MENDEPLSSNLKKNDFAALKCSFYHLRLEHLLVPRLVFLIPLDLHERMFVLQVYFTSCCAILTTNVLFIGTYRNYPAWWKIGYLKQMLDNEEEELVV